MPAEHTPHSRFLTNLPGGETGIFLSFFVIIFRKLAFFAPKDAIFAETVNLHRKSRQSCEYDILKMASFCLLALFFNFFHAKMLASFCTFLHNILKMPLFCSKRCQFYPPW